MRHSIKNDITTWLRSCTACQLAKVHHHTIAPLYKFTLPKSRLDSIHIDIVGLLPHSFGHNYIFTIINRFICWPEAIPMVNISAESCSKALLSGWLSHISLAKDIISDRRQQFVPYLWSQLLDMIGAKAAHTTAYHPHINGLLEKFHRQLKASIDN